LTGGNFQTQGNDDVPRRSYSAEDQAIVYAAGGEGTNDSTLASLTYEEQNAVWAKNKGSLFSRMANAPLMDQDVNLRNPKIRQGPGGSYNVLTSGRGMNSPIGAYNVTKATLGGTGAYQSTPATGFCAGGYYDGSGIRANTFGIVGIWHIEE
jgi:hypothetical protein